MESFKQFIERSQLEMGSEVEKEHKKTVKDLILKYKPNISNKELEKELNKTYDKIAKDHLKELPDYYTRLDKMEKGSD